MRSSLVAVLVAVAVAATLPLGCKKKEKSPEELAADKRGRCERIMSASIGMVTALGAGLGDALSDGEADMSCFKENPSDPAKCMTPEKAAEFRKKVAEGVDECMSWPDEFVACFERMDFESPGCEAAYRHFRGVVDSTPKAEGPAPLWEMALEHEPNGVAVLAGTLVYAHDDGVVAVRDGEVAWTKALAGVSGWLTPLAAGCVLAVHDAGVTCLAPADGAVRWQTGPLPDEADIAAAVATETGALVLDDQGRRHSFDAGRCAAGTAGAAGAAGAGAGAAVANVEGCRVSEKTKRRFFDDPYVATLPAGRFAVAAGQTLRIYEADGRPRVALAAKEWLSEVAAAGDTLWVAYDRSAARIDLAKCPAPAKADDGDGDTEPGSEAVAAVAFPGPCGTVVGSFDEDVSGYPPVPLDADRAALTTEHMVAVVGRDPWKAEVDSEDRIFLGDGVLYAVCSGDGGTPEVRAIATADGHTKWRTKLPTLPDVGFLDGPSLYADETNLYVTYKKEALALPKK